ncbi:DinB family protein [Paenibacillus xylaniclasticus]|uniref:DinB family protein n=1 Tax=Paenibacillus xylaniclasticus TaxID=588083 RepID=UPI000FD728B1|nr:MULTISPECIES: DinB family protein [Paenibacillus]GFN30267.1 hypothetical protein PCURB6_05270 [Paenibacillus curdlanolyticus]
MKYEFHRQWLTKKFEEIRRRLLKAIDQLSEEQLNWTPSPSVQSIPSILRHIEDNVMIRVRNCILHEGLVIDRRSLLEQANMKKEEAVELIERNMQLIIKVLADVSDETLEELQDVRGKLRSNLDMLHQCAAHYSEHMGQVFYVAKLSLGDSYLTTSV